MAVRKPQENAVESRQKTAGPAPNGPASATLRGDERMAAAPRGDLFARLLGFFIILLGVAIILGVVWLGLAMYRDPYVGLGPSAAHGTTNAADIGTNFMRLIVRIGLLFLGSICGSLIANKGIHLFFSSFPATPRT